MKNYILLVKKKKFIFKIRFILSINLENEL